MFLTPSKIRWRCNFFFMILLLRRCAFSESVSGRFRFSSVLLALFPVLLLAPRHQPEILRYERLAAAHTLLVHTQWSCRR